MHQQPLNKYIVNLVNKIRLLKEQIPWASLAVCMCIQIFMVFSDREQSTILK